MNKKVKEIKTMHTDSTWFHGSHYCSASLVDSIVYHLLIISEVTVGRKRTGDVRGIATVLSTHIKQAEEYKQILVVHVMCASSNVSHVLTQECIHT